MKVKVKSLSKCPTLRDPMDYSLPGSSVHGIFQARVLESLRTLKDWGLIRLVSSPTDYLVLAILIVLPIYEESLDDIFQGASWR